MHLTAFVIFVRIYRKTLGNSTLSSSAPRDHVKLSQIRSHGFLVVCFIVFTVSVRIAAFWYFAIINFSGTIETNNYHPKRKHGPIVINIFIIFFRLSISTDYRIFYAAYICIFFFLYIYVAVSIIIIIIIINAVAAFVVVSTAVFILQLYIILLRNGDRAVESPPSTPTVNDGVRFFYKRVKKKIKKTIIIYFLLFSIQFVLFVVIIPLLATETE